MSQYQGDKEPLKDLWFGIGIALGIYLLGILIMFTGGAFFFPYLCIAAIALIVVPIVSFAKGKKRLGQGALIGIGLNILLFTACFGMIISGLGG